MSQKRRPFFMILLAVAALAVAGCAAKSRDETGIPWSRPMDWEGKVPGLGI